MKKLMYSSMLYTILGMLSGLFYREMTRSNNFSGYSQLNVTHTHLLVLGTIMFLIFLLLESRFHLTQYGKLFNSFFYVYHAGVLITVAMQFVNGIATIKGFETGPAIAGISGLGHILITLAFVIFYIMMHKAIKSPSTK
ncbi:DUF2871 domain-containing protein [Staphylococcus felis]|uniref:DUF2871 domain-containing protein n=1 Tax=Staphylococcus felis TaxID=46127 RepID=UPI000E234544|nr:DUF2871 domain-containing protein [Staphylococcus felis]REH79674.1 hypothetical protein DOS57_02610 [Staphylococcus felis]REI15886.1 hypothetical protein DOS73_03895 [Staphylococcus felis]